MRLILILFLLSNSIIAQIPNSFNYQAVVRNSNGSELTNQIVSIKISIIKGSSSGQSMYSETHTVATNNYGLINIQIGAGSVLSGIFSAIEWGKDTYFVKTELDVSGGNNYELMGISQLLSVPYALHAKTAENVDDADADASNEIQTLSKSGSTVTLSKNGGSISVNDNDADSINEIQTLKLNGNKLEISKGNSITLSGVVDLDADPTNELQAISVSNDTVYLSKGGFAILPPDTDNDSANELQLLSVKSDTLFLSKGNYVVLPADFDADSTNEIQKLKISGDTVYLSKSNNILLADNDSTNELQTMRISNDSLILEKGNSIDLSQVINSLHNGTSFGVTFSKNIDLKFKSLCRIAEYEPSQIEYADLSLLTIDSSGYFISTYISVADLITKAGNLSTNGLYGAHIIKSDSNCNILWTASLVPQAGSTTYLYLWDIKTIGNSVFIFGHTGSGSAFTCQGTTIGQNLNFILKFDSTGNLAGSYTWSNTSLVKNIAVLNNRRICFLENFYFESLNENLEVSSKMVFNNAFSTNNGHLRFDIKGNDIAISFRRAGTIYQVHVNGSIVKEFSPTVWASTGIDSRISMIDPSNIGLALNVPEMISTTSAGLINWNLVNGTSVDGKVIDLKSDNDYFYCSYSMFPQGRKKILNQVYIDVIERNTIYIIKFDKNGTILDVRSVGNSNVFYGGALTISNGKKYVQFCTSNALLNQGIEYQPGCYIAQIFD